MKNKVKKLINPRIISISTLVSELGLVCWDEAVTGVAGWVELLFWGVSEVDWSVLYLFINSFISSIYGLG